MSVLAVLHDLNMAARYSDRVAITEEGRVTALGATLETLDAGRLSRTFKTPVIAVPGPGGPAFLAPG